MRQHAIEIGAIAEAELIRLGELGHEDRAVLTRKERRAIKGNGRNVDGVDNT